MNILFPLILVGLLIFSAPKIKRFFEDNPLQKLLMVFFWGITSFLAVYFFSLLRETYLVTTENSDSIFRAGGKIDEAYLLFTLLIIIFFAVMDFSFLKEKLWERFLFVFSLELLAMSTVGLLNNILIGTDIKNSLFFSGVVFLIGTILFIYNRRISDEKLGSLLKKFITQPFQ